MRFVIILFAGLLSFNMLPGFYVHANDLELSGQQRWVVVASRQHLNAAQIGRRL